MLYSLNFIRRERSFDKTVLLTYRLMVLNPPAAPPAPSRGRHREPALSQLCCTACTSCSFLPTLPGQRGLTHSFHGNLRSFTKTIGQSHFSQALVVVLIAPL